MVALTDPKQFSLLISLLLNFIINIIFLEMFKQFICVLQKNLNMIIEIVKFTLDNNQNI